MKMLTLASLITLFSTATAFAQSVETAPAPAPAEPETVFQRADEARTEVTGWFVAPTYATTGFAGTIASAPGLRAGIYLDRRVAIGVALNGIGNDQTTFSSSDNDIRHVGMYGGLLLQYVVQSNRMLHVSLESTIGSGRWCERVGDGNAAMGTRDGCDGRTFLAFEPVANLELNVARHMRIATGVGYRFAVAGDGQGPSSREMSGLVARSSLVFGSF
jgi:hypothetical protein